MGVTKRKRKLKDGKVSTRYEAAVFHCGTVVVRESFDTAAQAHLWHAEQKKLYKDGQKEVSETIKFKTVVEDYLNTAFCELRKSTQQARAPRLRYLFEGPLAGLLMKNLDDKAVDSWLVWLREHATTHRVQRLTFTQEIKLLSVILNWYRNYRDFKFQIPILRRHHKAAIFKTVNTRQQDYYMRPQEVRAWLQALKQRQDPMYHDLALLMVLTGLRVGEAAGLCQDAVVFEKDGTAKLRIFRTLSWDYRTKEAYFQDACKNSGSVRTVPVEGAALEMLMKRRRHESGGFIGAVPVFQTLRGRSPRDNSIRKNFNAAFADAKLQWTGTHIARHTFATLALISERDLGAVQAALGHISQKVTEGYAKNVALQTSRVTGKVSRLIGLSSSERNHGENRVSLLEGAN